MAKNDNKDRTVTEESFFLEDNTFGDNWMDTMIEQPDVQGELAVDVFETAKEVVVKAPVAGIVPDDLDITLTDEMIMIKGEKKRRKGSRKKCLSLSGMLLGSIFSYSKPTRKGVARRGRCRFQKWYTNNPYS